MHTYCQAIVDVEDDVFIYQTDTTNLAPIDSSRNQAIHELLQMVETGLTRYSTSGQEASVKIILQSKPF